MLSVTQALTEPQTGQPGSAHTVCDQASGHCSLVVSLFVIGGEFFDDHGFEG